MVAEGRRVVVAIMDRSSEVMCYGLLFVVVEDVVIIAEELGRLEEPGQCSNCSRDPLCSLALASK